MRVVNSTTVLEDRLRDGKITTGADAGASFTSQEMHKQVMLFVCFVLLISFIYDSYLFINNHKFWRDFSGRK